MNIMLKSDRLFSDKQCQRVRFSGFIHPTPRRVLLEKDRLTLGHFLVLSGRRPPLSSGHATVRVYDRVYRLLCG